MHSVFLKKGDPFNIKEISFSLCKEVDFPIKQYGFHKKQSIFKSTTIERKLWL